MQIIDTHAHLDHCEDLNEVLQRASESGVQAVVAVSEDLATSRKNLQISQKYSSPKIYCAMGIHPSEANIENLDETLDFIRDHLGDLVAIGEIGLDYWYKWVRKEKEKKDEQRTVFEKCLHLAKDLDLPVTIHSRGAWQDCIDAVKNAGIRKAIFHWYSGPVDILDKILEAGYFISATPSLAYSDQAREAVVHAPLNQLLIETDTPVYYRNKQTGEGFKSEPKDVLRTLDHLMQLKKIGLDEAVAILNQNARDFFNIQ